MTVCVQCDRAGCDVMEMAEWTHRPSLAGVMKIDVELPHGWIAEFGDNKLERVIHCPDHARWTVPTS